jgi:geranylgeranyl pyrophosphate synthase
MPPSSGINFEPPMSDVSSLTSFLNTVRTRVDEMLDRWLPRPPECPALVSEAMRYSVFAGGKRLRPVLVLAAADAVTRHRRRHLPSAPEDGGWPLVEAALPAACALELIHTYSLIHDDLPAMDNDTLRRGRPTAHVVYGDGIAILAGDGLQAAAFALLAREPHSDDPAIAAAKLRVIRVVADAAGPSGMVGGQAIDLQAAGQARERTLVLDGTALGDMHARKTGAIIRASAVAGGLMAGASDGLAAALDRYASDLGLAFQIVDDILDVEGDAATLGKTAGKDAASAKPSYPALFGLERSRLLAAECIDRTRSTLTDAGLEQGWLSPIADWMIRRRS